MSAAALVILLAAMIFPALPEAAQAVEGDGGATTYATGASVSLGVPATIDFEAVTPTANGATTTATANVTVATTNSAGYSLYLYAESGNNLVAQNPATTEAVTATASSATLDGLANNTWGYNLGTTTPGTGTTYAAVPTDGTTPVQTKDTSSTNAANDTYTLALGAKVDTTIPSGTYTGALTVAVVAEPGDIVINYDANGGYFNNEPGQTSNEVFYNVERLSTQTTSQEVESYDESFTVDGATSLIVQFSCYASPYGRVELIDSSGTIVASCTNGGGGANRVANISDTYVVSGNTVRVYVQTSHGPSSFELAMTGYNVTTVHGTQELAPTRSGYNFAGWYTDAAGTEGNEFIPNGNMTSGTTVYAKWEEAPVMQNFTNSQCQSLASDAPYIVKDSRDGNTYTVRYINGACWMTQNLRIAGGTTLNSSNSNISSSYIIPVTEVHDSGNTTDGCWYNFCTASAGTVCSASDDVDATSDICPSGWRLPNSGETPGRSEGDIEKFSPVLSGYYDDSLIDKDNLGYWWTSSTFGDMGRRWTIIYDHDYNDLGMLYESDRSMGYGFSIRCIRSS